MKDIYVGSMYSLVENRGISYTEFGEKEHGRV